MAKYTHRRDSVQKITGSYLAPGSSSTVLVYRPGGIVTSVTGLTTINLQAGHGFKASDKFIKSDGTSFSGSYSVSTAARTSVTMSGGDFGTLVAGDVLINLGPDHFTAHSRIAPRLDQGLQQSGPRSYLDIISSTGRTKPAMKKILIVDDEDSVRYSFRKLFRDPEYTVLEAANGRERLTVFSREKPDLVLLDIEMPVLGGIETIQRLKKMAPEIPVLIITVFGTTERVIAAMKYGAYDYLEKPFDVPRLKMIVKEALAMEDVSRGELVVGPESDHPDVAARIVGNSFPIKEVYKMIGRVAASDVSVLLVGESGTGKELVAAQAAQGNLPEVLAGIPAIHRLSFQRLL